MRKINIREISPKEFKSFAENTILGSFYQTLNYALLKAEEGYEYEFIGYFEGSTILGASLILAKNLAGYKYGYAPRGFLVDYTNRFLLKNFTDQIKKYYFAKNYVFIKINPEIAIGQMNLITKKITHNTNYSIVNDLINLGYKKLKDNNYFEALLPRINVIVPMKNFSLKNVNKNTRNKINQGIRKGLYLEKGTLTDIESLFTLIKNKKNKKIDYYYHTYNTFKKSDAIDLLLVKINYKKYLLNSQAIYNKELINNNILNNIIVENNNSKNINKKMNSDKALLTYKDDISEASKYLNTNKCPIIAAALVIKYKNRITININGFDQNFKRFSPNYFLFYALIKYYKDEYDYIDLNGITADLSKESPYYGLNQFKLGFKPDIYEYIGEFDLIINEKIYNYWLKTNVLAHELNK